MCTDKKCDGKASPGSSIRKDCKKGRNTRGLFLMTTGLLLIAAALVLVLYNIWDDGRAGKASAEIIRKLEMTIENEGSDLSGADEPDKRPVSSGYEAGKEMQTVEIDGLGYSSMLYFDDLYRI